MTTLKNLHDYESNTSIREILFDYFYVNNDNDLLDAIRTEDNDVVWCWEQESKLDRDNLMDLIKGSLDNRGKFIVLEDESSSGGWPEVAIQLTDNIRITFVWVTED